MAAETKQTHNETTHALRAEDIMDRNCLILSQQVTVREAARLLDWTQSRVAAVIDTNGRCVGVVRAADIVRWMEACSPEVVIGVGLPCLHQVRGHLLNGDDAEICTLAHGTCKFQLEQPTTGGRRTTVCAYNAASKHAVGTTSRYMATDFVGIRPRAPLREMVKHVTNTRAHELVVLSESDRPVGIISAADVLMSVIDRKREKAK